MTFDVPSLLVLAALMFLLAGFVKGVIGMGLPTVAMGLLSLAMAPAQAAALMVAPSLVTNLWLMFAGPGLMPLLRRFWPMIQIGRAAVRERVCEYGLILGFA